MTKDTHLLFNYSRTETTLFAGETQNERLKIVIFFPSFPLSFIFFVLYPLWVSHFFIFLFLDSFIPDKKWMWSISFLVCSMSCLFDDSLSLFPFILPLGYLSRRYFSLGYLSLGYLLRVKTRLYCNTSARERIQDIIWLPRKRESSSELYSQLAGVLHSSHCMSLHDSHRKHEQEKNKELLFSFSPDSGHRLLVCQKTCQGKSLRLFCVCSLFV